MFFRKICFVRDEGNEMMEVLEGKRLEILFQDLKRVAEAIMVKKFGIGWED